jgi:hypothetical protein
VQQRDAGIARIALLDGCTCPSLHVEQIDRGRTASPRPSPARRGRRNRAATSSPASAFAISCAISTLYAPSTQYGGAAGLVSGPSTLKIVRTFIAWRTGAIVAIAG